MKNEILLLFCLCVFTTTYGQDRFLMYTAPDSINGMPKFKSSLGANLKLNGYYDVFGGLQESETFNIGLIDVFGTDDSGSFKMDMYQTQLVFKTSLMSNEGKSIDAVVEFDFWGGNGQMRLRQAYVEFEHWQIGQTWSSFGDEEIWPNIMEWEGPPSGIWVRSPHIKYSNTFKSNPNWGYILAVDAPITDYNRYGEIEPLVENAYQVVPDFVAGIKHENEWGHIRLSSILRNIKYKFNDETDTFLGYGFSLSGMLKNEQNNLQYQLTGGKGITAYITSVGGFGYDGFPTINGDFEATPAYGGWISYEHFWTPKVHSNMVFGYTRFYTNDVSRFLFDDKIDESLIVNGDINHKHSYGILNVMYDPFSRMTFGFEIDYGIKYLDVSGTLNNTVINESKKRDALRISFGFMFYL